MQAHAQSSVYLLFNPSSAIVFFIPRRGCPNRCRNELESSVNKFRLEKVLRLNVYCYNSQIAIYTGILAKSIIKHGTGINTKFIIISGIILF